MIYIMPYLLFLKNRQNLKLSSAANVGGALGLIGLRAEDQLNVPMLIDTLESLSHILK